MSMQMIGRGTAFEDDRMSRGFGSRKWSVIRGLWFWSQSWNTHLYYSTNNAGYESAKDRSISWMQFTYSSLSWGRWP
jgi:hypothetical protein